MSQSPERVVIITGCSNGSLGAALAERFASQGCNVFATARNVTKMGSLSSGISKVELDVLSDASVHSAVEGVVAQAGRIDILVNCAGGNHVGALMDLSLEDIEALFKTNLFGTMRVTKAVVQHMVERKSGLIINLGSVAAQLRGTVHTAHPRPRCTPTPKRWIWNCVRSISKCSSLRSEWCTRPSATTQICLTLRHLFTARSGRTSRRGADKETT